VQDNQAAGSFSEVETKHTGLQPGSAVSGRFRVLRSALRESRSGTRYLVMSLSAMGAPLPAVMFEVAEGYPVPESGSQVDVQGLVQEYRGTLRLKVRSMVTVASATADSAGAPKPSLTDGERFGASLVSISDPDLRESVKRVLRVNGLFRAFKRAAAPARVQPGGVPVPGSALADTLAVAAVAEALCKPHPELNRDVVLAAALLHLVGVVDVSRPLSTDRWERYQVPVSVLSTHRIRAAARAGHTGRLSRESDLLRVEEVILGAAHELEAGAGAAGDPEAAVLAAAISASRATRLIAGSAGASVQPMRCVG